MKITSLNVLRLALLALVLIDVCSALPQGGGDDDASTEGRGCRRGGRGKKPGRGLHKCRAFRPGCSLKKNDLDLPMYLVDEAAFDADASTKCADYAPEDKDDVGVADPHDAVQEMCESSEPGAEIRLCIMKKKQLRQLLKEQDLEEADVDDLDLGDLDLADMTFKGRCFTCPGEADDGDNDAGDGQTGVRRR